MTKTMKKRGWILALAVAGAVFLAAAGMTGRNVSAAGSPLAFGPGAVTEFQLEYGKITQDVTVDILYSGTGTISVERGYAPGEDSKNIKTTLTSDAYTYGDGKLTLGKEYLSGLEQGTFWYAVTDGRDTLEFPVFIGYGGGWSVRTGRGTVTENAQNETLQDLSLNGYYHDVEGNKLRVDGGYDQAGRAFYTRPLDVTKPIFIEYDNYVDNGWILFNLNDDPFAVEYADERPYKPEEGTGTPGIVTLLDMMDNGGEPQRLGGSAGFITNSVVNIGSFLNENNSNIIEIFVGERTEDSYIKYNGEDLTQSFRDTGSVTLKRSDFAENEAWLSVFCGTPTGFSVAKDLGAPAVYYPDGEPSYTLKSADDVKFRVHNLTDGALTLKCGDTVLTRGTDYTLQGERLTVLGAFMKTIPYTRTVVFTLESGGKETQVRVPAAPETGSSTAKLAEGDDGIRVFAGEDLTYRFDLGGEAFVNVIDAQTEQALPAELYSLSGTTLTLKASAFEGLEKGVYRFLLQTEGSLVPFLAIHYGFENGWAALDGLQVTASDDFTKFSAEGAGGLAFREFFDLTKVLELKLAVTESPGYYNNGTGDRDAYVELIFQDVGAGTSFVLRIRPNAAADQAQIRNKLYVELEFLNAAGSVTTLSASALRLDPDDEHAISVTFVEGKFSVKLGEEAPIEADLSGFDFDEKTVMLSARTKAAMKYMLTMPESTNSANNVERGCGCGSSAGFAGLLALSLLSLFRIKR